MPRNHRRFTGMEQAEQRGGETIPVFKTDGPAIARHVFKPLRQRRDIAPQPFLYEAADRRVDEVLETYAKQLEKLATQQGVPMTED